MTGAGKIPENSLWASGHVDDVSIMWLVWKRKNTNIRGQRNTTADYLCFLPLRKSVLCPSRCHPKKSVCLTNVITPFLCLGTVRLSVPRPAWRGGPSTVSWTRALCASSMIANSAWAWNPDITSMLRLMHTWAEVHYTWTRLKSNRSGRLYRLCHFSVWVIKTMMWTDGRVTNISQTWQQGITLAEEIWTDESIQEKLVATQKNFEIRAYLQIRASQINKIALLCTR